MATQNPHKAREIGEILGVEVEMVNVDIPELQGLNFEEIVKQKAELAYKELQEPVLVEDSGLVFNSWNGLPGPLVKWFEESVKLEGMVDMLTGDRAAEAVCALAMFDGETAHVVVGREPGRISHAVRGDNGFGWDKIFIKQGQERTNAEMSAMEKHETSHRRKACDLMIATDWYKKLV